MLLFRHLQAVPFSNVEVGSVVTIGSFDGLHLGHQDLLNRLKKEAKTRRLPSILMSFEPTPKEFFLSNNPPARLMRFGEKFEALRASGIDIFFCPRFDSLMQSISADTFIRQILIHALNVKCLIIGDDFRFARDRQGDVNLLRQTGKSLGFDLIQAPSVEIEGTRISSSKIREALLDGNLEFASTLLGRPYRMSGRVIKGRQVGIELGYPTANINLNRKQSSVNGIFAVRVCSENWGPFNAVASIGTRPTFGELKPILEVHIFDFNKNIYGEYIHVDFLSRLRDEEKFENGDMLIDQMNKDSALARKILAESK